jgi:phage baseplate assembly protein W
LAILDKSKNNFVVDRDDSKSIGLKLPLVLDNGTLASTKTTLDAVKQNVISLLNTEIGERVMQPKLGVKLKKFLFEPFTENVILQVKDVIIESMNYWLPFVVVNEIEVEMSESEKSTMNISVNFSLKKDPNKHESIQVIVGE